MNELSTRRLGRRFGLMTATALLVCSCQDVKPREAGGFRAEQLAKVSLGMSRGDIRAIMGPPLQEHQAAQAGETSALWYAEPGALWIMGEYKTNVRGFECVMWLRDGNLTDARVFNAATGTVCHCNEESCSLDWADACFIRNGAKDEGAG